MIIIFTILLTACNSDSTDGGSYQSIINLNGTNYYYTSSNEEEYTQNSLIGTIEDNVKPEEIPSKHLTSNELETGTEIYSTNESDEYFIANDEQNTYLYTLEKNIKSSD